MTSQAKLAANRANGQKSRGPRSAAGKSSASRNAFRHGLAAITRTKPATFAEIEPIATALCDEADDPLLFEQALIIAENEFVLRCVRVERIAAIERLRDRTATPLATGDLGLSRAKARLERAKLTYQMLVQSQNDASNNNANPTTSSDLHRRWQERRERASAERAAREKLMQQRHEFDAMRLALPDLHRLERYERRAWSRQTRAIRRFIESSQPASLKKARARRRVRTVTEPSSPACCLDPRAGKAAERVRASTSSTLRRTRISNRAKRAANLLPTVFRNLPRVEQRLSPLVSVSTYAGIIEDCN